MIYKHFNGPVCMYTWYLCMCIYVCVHVCVCIRIYMYVYVCGGTNKNACIYMHIQQHECKYIHTSHPFVRCEICAGQLYSTLNGATIHAYMYVCIHTHTQTYINTYTHLTLLCAVRSVPANCAAHSMEQQSTHIYIYIYIYTYTHTHTYIHSYIHTSHPLCAEKSVSATLNGQTIHSCIHTYIHTYKHLTLLCAEKSVPANCAAHSMEQQSMHTYMYVYTHTPRHTYIHTNVSPFCVL